LGASSKRTSVGVILEKVADPNLESNPVMSSKLIHILKKSNGF
jgi:hypothetical protein